jgi:pimeloyl-ACP methyl ester carboxylesterase
MGCSPDADVAPPRASFSCIDQPKRSGGAAMATIPVRDFTLYYEQTGRGPQLLFIHGMCGDADVWFGQVARLADRFTCITYDRRGHSRSMLGTEPESVETHAADAAALIEGLHLDRPLVVGSSGGARIAVELARSRPDLLAGAVLSEPPIVSLEPEAGRQFMAEVAATVAPAAQTGGPRAAVDAFFPLVCPGLWSQLDEPGRDRLRANGQMMLAEFAGPPYVLTLDQAAGIDLPALVIAGTTSHPALRAIAATLARTLPDARLLELDGSGHVTYVERPDDFARAVREHADRVLARDRSAVPGPAR